VQKWASPRAPGASLPDKQPPEEAAKANRRTVRHDARSILRILACHAIWRVRFVGWKHLEANFGCAALLKEYCKVLNTLLLPSSAAGEYGLIEVYDYNY
jgi:hypothetical protein